MDPFEASMPGTLRTILILIAMWWILRLLMKRNATKQSGGNTLSSSGRQVDQRPKGEIRVENVPPDKDSSVTNGTITDADFEEIK
ncbi:MAG: hypothetical protein WAR83_02235 [Flavobacteriales bacterium]|jgi:hypothetical protein|nr:hypothetical protein [Flavobacteriales bacterium]